LLSRWYRPITNEENNFPKQTAKALKKWHKAVVKKQHQKGTMRKGDKRVESCCLANAIALTGMQLEYNMSQIRTKSQSETMMFSCAIRF
jgi:hypothetical protein